MRDVTRTAVAMEQLSKRAQHWKSGVFMWSAQRPLQRSGAVNTRPQQ
jgi:hypothetical protein